MLRSLNFALRSAAILAMLEVGACGSGSLGDQPTLSGQIDGWNKGTDYTLQATVADSAAQNLALSSAPIDAAGNFSIVLPGAAAVAPYAQLQHIDLSKPIEGCTSNNLQLSPQDLSSAILVLRAVSGDTKLTVTQSIGISPSGSSVSYVYVDRDVSETGNLSCAFGSTAVQESVDIHFGTGWNIEALVLSATSITATSGKVPDGVKWTAK